MNRTILTTALFLGAAVGASFPAGAQSTQPAHATTGSVVQRDVNQQQRIENGLQSGSITTREGALLEHDQARVDRLESRDLRDGTLSPAERARLTAAQNRTSQEIRYAAHNGLNGNPLSASSQREQAEVQRNINQEGRIEAGLQNGGVTNREAGRLERGESRIDQREFEAGRDGRVGAREEQRVANRDNRESWRIRQQRWDAQHRH